MRRGSRSAKAVGWTILYFFSDALVAAFLTFDVLVGVVINSLQEARASEAASERPHRFERADPDEPVIEERIAAVREALDHLEADVRRGRV
jgi:voltage-gated sodium channel